MNNIIKKFLAYSLEKKVLFITFIVVIGLFVYSKFVSSKKNSIQYQTAQAERGILIVSVSGSGKVSTANSGTISTLATGVISKLYVKDGDEMKTGDKIAEVDLDLKGQQNVAQAWSSYQSAKNNLENAKSAMYTTQSDMFTNWKKFYDTAINSTYQNSDGSPKQDNRGLVEFNVLNDNWLSSELKYKTQQNVVNQAQTALNAAWLSYQQTSSTIYAPISGTVSGLSLQIGSVIVESTNTSNSAQSATKIANIKTKALPMVTINLTEIDVLPNMAASANIITITKNDALFVPASSVKKQNGEVVVQIMKNGKPQSVTVETGLSSDTQTEIISGISDGDIVVTSIIQPANGTQSRTQSTSPFGGFGGGAFRLGGGGGGGRRD
ncbi:efflux RND transporter periplasmic adaptor subunit [Candidatus Roizmanbacteria bacterium]|nr:efflux RND transporter periplasmic adaptor subunit [Candidatus Roizmanbacteria bacterium]